MTSLQSDAARAARVVCIFFMSYVHLHFFVLAGATFPITDIIVVNTFSRSSVPLLSVLSGYLMVGFFARRPYTQAVMSRGRSLIVPMAIWNLIACILFGFTYPIWDALIAATDESKLVYLSFLRDLFILSLFVPVLIVWARNAPKSFALCIFVYYVSGWSNFVIFRPQRVFFFNLGILFALYPQPMPRNSRVIALIGIIGAIVWQLFFPELSGFYFDNLYLRPVTAFGFWVLALWIAAKHPDFGRFDKTAFAFFLTHGVIFTLVGSIYSRLPALHTIPIYYTVWILTPLISYAAIYLLWPLSGRLGRAITA
ncbi:MAG: hypothetical protein NWP79_07350 [Paracoccaceae bacterium]|nr:hypothetical protein [Paracoccaceae bacterium]